VLIKTLQDKNNAELLKQFDFNNFNFGQALSSMQDTDDIIQNLLDSRFYDNANNDDYLSYF